jgi:site-specific DNA-methyltransferase (adenine-specific)
MNKETRVEIINGDSLKELPRLASRGRFVAACLTSPPYAMQRAAQYGGVAEEKYPDWSRDWMRGLQGILTDDGSAVINIREHVRDGELSDYVLKTRLKLRGDGWRECDELIWFKPNAPPVGDPVRPRRSWERLLWFSRSRRPFVNPTANGNDSDRVGISASIAAHGWATEPKKEHRSGVARCSDVAVVPLTGNMPSTHPAAFPLNLARWMVRLFVPEGGTCLDPFGGSFRMAVACVLEGRDFIGVEQKAEYCADGERFVSIARGFAEEFGPGKRDLAETPLFGSLEEEIFAGAEV